MHGFPKHWRTSEAEPKQGEPSPLGEGLLHIRFLNCLPIPQLEEQGVQVVHGDHIPFSEQSFVAQPFISLVGPSHAVSSILCISEHDRFLV